MKISPARLALAMVLGGWNLPAQVSATIDIDATHATPLNSGFSGFNDEVTFPVEYFDYRFNNLAAQLSPGWVRYPSGIFADAFEWQTGLMVPAWAAQFQGTNIATLLSESVPWVNGKGGGSFVEAANRADFLGAKVIVDVNGYTDTPQSAGQMAAFAQSNRIPVAVWELSNEPYFYKQFFASGADYVAKMKPYRDAIKAADPDAVVAIFFDDAGNTNGSPPWDQSIASYADKYWDAVTYHQYPPQSNGPFSQWMADENAVLVSKTTSFVTGHLAALNPAGMKFLISEFLPSNDGLGTDTSLTDGTLYGAIYAAEYTMRMSALPSMLYVGMHALSGTTGVYAARTHDLDCQNAYHSGATIDTRSLNFGFFLTPQPMGLAVLNGILKNANQVLATSLTGGATVPATVLGQIPALYAQAYAGASGLESLAITNKSASAQQVTTAVAANPVTVPAYSVMRVDLSTPARVIAVNGASYAVGSAAAQEYVALCLPTALTLGGAGDTLYIELYGTGIRRAASVECLVGGPKRAGVVCGAGGGVSRLGSGEHFDPGEPGGVGAGPGVFGGRWNGFEHRKFADPVAIGYISASSGRRMIFFWMAYCTNWALL